MPANSINAGKASLESTRSILDAALGHQCLTPIPITIGKNISSRFCTSRLPTGREQDAPPSESEPLDPTVHCIIKGTVNSVIILLNAVRITESATSPLASMEKTLLLLPPGQHAISTTPTNIRGGKLNAHASTKANNGRSII